MKTNRIFAAVIAGVISASVPAWADTSGHGPQFMQDQTMPMAQMDGQFMPGMMRNNMRLGPSMMGTTPGMMPMMGAHHGMMPMMGAHHGMVPMMMQMHGTTMHGMHGAGIMQGNWMNSLDTDDDGTLSSAEFEAELKARAEAHDTDSDGTLSIDEFEALYAGLIRETMVDRFQQLDANGDGEVTSGEISSASQSLNPGFHWRHHMTAE